MTFSSWEGSRLILLPLGPEVVQMIFFDQDRVEALSCGQFVPEGCR